MRIFIGYDERQPIAYTVAQQSILNHTSKPVSIHPLKLATLPIKRKGLTPFTYSRFLVPWLCGYQGRAVFMDSDFMCRADIAQMPVEEGYAVCVSKNERRFEWPSLMAFDCAKCEILTPRFVSEATSGQLFGLAWASSVGEIPCEWNHLVGYDRPDPNAKMVHFTKGLPCFPEIVGADREHGDEWISTARQAVNSASWHDLMGNSVHAEHLESRRNSGR